MQDGNKKYLFVKATQFVLQELPSALTGCITINRVITTTSTVSITETLYVLLQ